MEDGDFKGGKRRDHGFFEGGQETTPKQKSFKKSMGFLGKKTQKTIRAQTPKHFFILGEKKGRRGKTPKNPGGRGFLREFPGETGRFGLKGGRGRLKKGGQGPPKGPGGPGGKGWPLLERILGNWGPKDQKRGF